MEEKLRQNIFLQPAIQYFSEIWPARKKSGHPWFIGLAPGVRKSTAKTFKVFILIIKQTIHVLLKKTTVLILGANSII